MDNKLKVLASDFEKAINQMQLDLQYLADKGNVKKGFIDKQNLVRKALISYYNYSELQIEHLQNELVTTQVANNKERKKLNTTIVKLEATCILHGVLDFPRFLAMPKTTLINWVEQLYKEGRFLYSDMFKSWLKKLSPVKRKSLLEIINEDATKEIKQLFKSLKNSNLLKNGNRI